jgi:hypothetical protein
MFMAGERSSGEILRGAKMVLTGLETAFFFDLRTNLLQVVGFDTHRSVSAVPGTSTHYSPKK